MLENEKAIHDEIDTDIGEQENGTCLPVPWQPPLAAPKNDMDSAAVPAVASASEESEGKALYDLAKESLSEWEVAYFTHEKALANLKAGDKHEVVYEALRDVVFFAIWAMDNQEEALDSFNEWELHQPARSDTNPYAQPVDMMFANAGISLDSITAKRCEWAKIAEYVHPIVKKGLANESNFIRLVKSNGGIHAFYKKATADSKKPSGRKSGGGKGMSSADADKAFQKNFDKLKASQSSGSTERHLVAVVLDIADSKTYPSLSRVERIFGDLKETVFCFEIDETVLELMEEGGETDA